MLGVPNLTYAITTTECLIEFKKESSKLRGKKTQGDSNSDEDRNKCPWRDKPTIFKDKGRDKKDENRGNTHASYATGFIGFSSARSIENMLCLSRKKRGMKRKQVLPRYRS